MTPRKSRSGLSLLSYNSRLNLLQVGDGADLRNIFLTRIPGKAFAPNMLPPLAAITELKGEPEDNEEEPSKQFVRTESDEKRARWPTLSAISAFIAKDGEPKYGPLADLEEIEEERETHDDDDARAFQKVGLPFRIQPASGGKHQLGSMLGSGTLKARAEVATNRAHRETLLESEASSSPSKWKLLKEKRGSIASAHSAGARWPTSKSVISHRKSLGIPLSVHSQNPLNKFKQQSMRNLASWMPPKEDKSAKGWLLNGGDSKREAWRKNKGFNSATLDVSSVLSADVPDSLQQNIYRVRKSVTPPSCLDDSLSSLTRDSLKSKRRKKAVVWSGAHPLSAMRLAAEKKLVLAIGRLYRADPKDRPGILSEIGEIKMIKGHPQAAKALVRMLKDKAWRTRLRALQLIPRMVIKGDQDAIEAVVDRLLDWNLDVRRAAVATLRDSPAKLHCDILSAKDLAVLGGEFEGGVVWCAVQLSSSSDHISYQTQKEDYVARPHWNHHYFLKLLDPDESVVTITVLASPDPKDPTADRSQVATLASVSVTLPEIYDEIVHAAQWYPLVDDRKQPAGALSIKWRFELGDGIGLKSEMTEIIQFVEPALVDDDFWTRKEALQLYSDYFGPGSLEATRVLARGLQDVVGDVRWTAVDGLRRVLSTLDQACCLLVLELTAPLVRYEGDAEIRAGAIEVLCLAARGVPGWKDPADGASLKEVMEERLDDEHWMVRRIAVLAFAEMSAAGERASIIALLPFLGDDVFYVRVNAARGLATLAGGLMRAEREASDDDVELVKAIMEGYRDLEARQADMDEEEAEGLEGGDEYGTRFGLLFQLGVQTQSGWDSKEHATWEHVKAWADRRWASVLQLREQRQQRVAGEKRMLRNKWVQVGIRLYGLDPKYKGHMSEELSKAVEWAREHAACLIQALVRGRWGRRVAAERGKQVAEARKLKVAKERKEEGLTPIQLLQLRMKMANRKVTHQQSVHDVFAHAGATETPQEAEDSLRFMVATPQADVRTRAKRASVAAPAGSGHSTPHLRPAASEAHMPVAGSSASGFITAAKAHANRSRRSEQVTVKASAESDATKQVEAQNRLPATRVQPQTAQPRAQPTEPTPLSSPLDEHAHKAARDAKKQAAPPPVLTRPDHETMREMLPSHRDRDTKPTAHALRPLTGAVPTKSILASTRKEVLSADGSEQRRKSPHVVRTEWRIEPLHKMIPHKSETQVKTVRR